MRKLIIWFLLSGACYAQHLRASQADLGSINGVVHLDNVTYTTFAAAAAACPNPGQLIVDVPGTWAVSTNLTIPSTCSVQINKGAIISPNKAVAVSFNGPLSAGPYQIFSGAGTVSLGTLIPNASVEWFGAVGDWNGSTGTDDTAAINACFTSLTNGVCALQAEAYKTSSALSITTSNVGLQGVSVGYPSSGSYPTPSPSEIISSSVSADILDVAGTSASQAIAFNVFRNFTLGRTQTASGTAKGLSLKYVDGTYVSGVTSEDSIIDFYILGNNSTGLNNVYENDMALWGYTSLNEPSGSLYGWEVDSTGAVTSNSLYLRNTGANSNYSHVGGSTTYGYYITGSANHDFFCYQCNASDDDYGIYINSTSSSFTASSDMHILNSVIDGCNKTCIYTTGISGTLSITGGWFFTSGKPTTAVMDFESSANISVVNATLYFPAGTGGGILANRGNSIQVVGTKFSGLNAGPAITYDAIGNGVISANDAGGVTATSIINIIASTNLAISDNTLSGTATNGIALDPNSHSISGLETNVCGGSGGTVTTCINDSGSNSTNTSVITSNRTITLSSSAFTSVGFNNGASVFILTDPTNSGTAIVLFDNTGGITIVSQSGTTVFTTSSPSSTQIELQQSGNFLQAKGGSSRNNIPLNWMELKVR
jgi:hypothetical protein